MVTDLQKKSTASQVENSQHSSSSEYDVIVIGSGIGGLVTATQLAADGAKVLVLERYLIPGGSAGYFEREGYRFDVGASMIFGFGDKGTTNLLTRALDAVDESIETIPDPVQIHY
ncbi:MAG: FAD-dependent oxidoreductase, partial [Cyanobacteria bacterium J06627_8]